MPTTTPNPAELAEEIKRQHGDALNAMCAGDERAAAIASNATEAAIDQLRDLASGPSAGAVALPIIGYMVHGDDIAHAALYQISQTEEAFEAARRWKRSITAVVQHPDAPLLPVILSDERISFGLEGNLEDPSEEETRGFYAGVRFAERALYAAPAATPPAEKSRAQKLRDAGFERRPTTRELTLREADEDNAMDSFDIDGQGD